MIPTSVQEKIDAILPGANLPASIVRPLIQAIAEAAFSVGGGGGGSIVTDETLTGDATSESPLSVVTKGFRPKNDMQATSAPNELWDVSGGWTLGSFVCHSGILYACKDNSIGAAIWLPQGGFGYKKIKFTLSAAQFNILESNPFEIPLPSGVYHLISANVRFSGQSTAPNCGEWYINDNDGYCRLLITVPNLPLIPNVGWNMEPSGDMNLGANGMVTLQLSTNQNSLSEGDGNCEITIYYIED